MRTLSESNKKLNALFVEYREASKHGATKDGRTPSDIFAEMCPVAEECCAPVLSHFRRQYRLVDRAGTEFIDNAVFDKLGTLVNWPKADPSRFDSLLRVSVKNALLAELKKHIKRSDHERPETDISHNEEASSPLRIGELLENGAFHNGDNHEEQQAILMESELAEMRKIYKSCLQCFNAKQLSIFRLRLEGRAYKEIVSTLNVPMGTVMSSLHRVREVLNKQDKKISHILDIMPDDMNQMQQAFIGKMMRSVIDELIGNEMSTGMAR